MEEDSLVDDLVPVGLDRLALELKVNFPEKRKHQASKSVSTTHSTTAADTTPGHAGAQEPRVADCEGASPNQGSGTLSRVSSKGVSSKQRELRCFP